MAVCSYHSDMVATAALNRALTAPYAALTRGFLRTVDAVLVASPQLAENSRFLATVQKKVRGGPLRGDLGALAEQLGLGGRVHFVGSVSRSDLVALFHAADVLALPSVTPNEAFGLVQLEAHACGVPVVSTSLPTGVPFANLHGVTGLVVTPGDVEEPAAVLGLLLEDDALRAELGGRARARLFNRFTLDGMVDRVVGIYEELAGAH